MERTVSELSARIDEVRREMENLMIESYRLSKEFMDNSINSETLQYMDTDTLKLYKRLMNLMDDMRSTFDRYILVEAEVNKEVLNNSRKLDKILEMLEK